MLPRRDITVVQDDAPAIDALRRLDRRTSGLTWRAILVGLVFTALVDLWIHWAQLILGGRGHTALANTSIPIGAFTVNPIARSNLPATRGFGKGNLQFLVVVE